MDPKKRRRRAALAKVSFFFFSRSNYHNFSPGHCCDVDIRVIKTNIGQTEIITISSPGRERAGFSRSLCLCVWRWGAKRGP